MRAMFGSVFGRAFPFRDDLTPVELFSADGSKLEAATAKAKGEARGVVVFCHPFLKYGCHYFERSGHLDFFTGIGFHGLLFNFKGFGKSELKGVSFFDDAIGAVALAKKLHPGLPVHLVGLSFGAYHGVHALARMDGEVHTALLDSVPPDAVNFFNGPVALAFRMLNGSSFGRLCGTEPIFTDLAAIRRTSLHLVLGDADRYILEHERKALPSHVAGDRINWAKGVGHMEIFKKERGQYERLAALLPSTPEAFAIARA